MSENRENKKYVLLEVTGIDQWGGLPDVEPIVFADTKEELEELCEKNGYEYKDSAYPTHYIETTESYMERLNTKYLDNYVDPNPKIASIKLRGIPYVELLNIFDNERLNILEGFITLKHIILDETYTDIKFSHNPNDDYHYDNHLDMKDVPIKNILGIPTNLFVTISDHNNTDVREMIDTIRKVLCYHMSGLSDPYTGYKTYHGLAGTLLECNTKNEQFIFEIEDTNHKKYYIPGNILEVRMVYNVQANLVIKFRTN